MAFLIGSPLVLVASFATYRTAFRCGLASPKQAQLYCKLLIEPGEFVACWIPLPKMTLDPKRTELMPRHAQEWKHPRIMTRDWHDISFLQNIQGIPCEILNRSLKAMQVARHDLAKQMPDIQQIRESLEHQLICKMEEKVSLSSGRPAAATNES